LVYQDSVEHEINDVGDHKRIENNLRRDGCGSKYRSFFSRSFLKDIKKEVTNKSLFVN